MAISSSGCFDYTIAVNRAGAAWCGCAEAPASSSSHPGLAGSRPRFSLAAGVITLRATVAGISLKTNPHYRAWGPPASVVSMTVGPAVEAVLEDGDVLRMSRYGTADLGISIHKGEDLKMGLGAVASGHLGSRVTVEEDPRAEDTSLIGVARWLERPNTRLIWVNVSEVNHEFAVRSIQHAPPGRLVIAIAGQDPERRRQMNHRIAAGPLPAGQSSCVYVDVDARFSEEAQWLQFVRSLPKSRPDDLWLRICIGDVRTTLREGAYAFADPWHLFVRKVYEPGLPGELSQLAIARSNPALSQAALIESANIVATGGIEITR